MNVLMLILLSVIEIGFVVFGVCETSAAVV